MPLRSPAVIAGCDLQPADIDGHAEFDDVRIGVRDAGAAGETLKAEGLQRAQIADDPVGDTADTSERPADFGMNLAEKRSCSGNVIEIPDHHDLRSGSACDVAPPVRALIVAMPRDGRSGGSYGPGHCISGDWRQSGKQAAVSPARSPRCTSGSCTFRSRSIRCRCRCDAEKPGYRKGPADLRS